ncbi:MAG: thioredoxin fold domain-containing protein [Proteobacteria bacterium]|nr:thioredoxin fold domain-containing protein [Pseudomonadota bacterium]
MKPKKVAIILALNLIVVAVYLVAIHLMPDVQTAHAVTDENLQENPCEEYGISAIETHAFLPADYKILSMRPVDNLCEIAIESQNKYATLYTHKDYVIIGDLFKEKKAVTRDLVDEIEGRVIEENRKALEQCTAITYTPVKRNINRTLYMVVTPGCHFCEEAEDEIEFLAERYGLTIKMIIYTDENKKAVQAVCRNIPISEFNSPEFKTTEPAEADLCDRGQEIIAKTPAVIDRIGIKGFPTFIFDTGKKFAGANMEHLEKQIVITLESIEHDLIANRREK